ncbi:hypothetical protein [Treponema zioleckii]|uniref:hypothetical protein n=1 Tax=Treponema zioleckii TaxID=331680 RepID=UPI00168BC3D2|nr:hypothetical protein [Treponema zioleckii]
MKKITKFIFAVVLAIFIGTAFFGCSVDTADGNTEQEETVTYAARYESQDAIISCQ